MDPPIGTLKLFPIKWDFFFKISQVLGMDIDLNDYEDFLFSGMM
jgi:hypothetical protein